MQSGSVGHGRYVSQFRRTTLDFLAQHDGKGEHCHHTRAVSFRPLASVTIRLSPPGLASQRLANESNESGDQRKSYIVICCAEATLHPNPGLQLSCTGSTNMGGGKQSPRQRRAPTLMRYWRPCRRTTFLSASYPLKMCTGANPIQRYTC